MRGEELKAAWLKEWDEANKLFESGNVEGAEERLANCARLSPETWAGLGMAALENKDAEGALKRFNEAYGFATRPSTKAICLNNIGSVLADTGHRDLALSYFLKTVELFPFYPDAFANVAMFAVTALALPDKAGKLTPEDIQRWRDENGGRS